PVMARCRFHSRPATKFKFKTAAKKSGWCACRGAASSKRCVRNCTGEVHLFSRPTMVRLKDIALRGGVSVMTVSKVLRNAPDISPATKARIKMLAEEMGYVPDSLAQGLRTRTTRTIGLVISAVTNPIFARAILAIEQQAHDLGYELILAHSL